MKKETPFRAVFISGHPYAGKVTAAKIIKSAIGQTCHIRHFAEPLKTISHTIAGMPEDTPYDFFEGTKDLPSEHLPQKEDGMHFTPREFYIFVDRILKAGNLNEGVLGSIMLKRHVLPFMYDDALLVIPDSGFAEAAQRIIDVVGIRRCMHIELSRPAVLSNLPYDSRSPWKIDGLAHHIIINKDLSMFRLDVMRCVTESLLDSFK